MYTASQSHYAERKIDKKDPEWLNERAKITRQNEVRREDSANEKGVLKQEARDMRLFAKEFGLRRSPAKSQRQNQRKNRNSAGGSNHDPTNHFPSNGQ